MSSTIDQRVVEMRFDNSQFEKNVSTTMSTLEKLKQKLNLSGASKGLDNINASAKKVDMSSLGGAVETVSAKFSALQVMGVTALANITNSAVNAGKNIVRSLTIDPVKTGFNEYELKMGSIQTIMAGTGESLDRVNQKLNELNEYSDQTIYSFKDMTDNIGKFTNAGVNLDDAVAAIKGISNAAALSGASSNEASRAMYNFSQALSSGYVQLMDWRSIELANMATAEFRQQLLDAAVATGSLTKESEGLYKTLDGNEVTVKNFRNTLQDKWLTSEALVNALNKYADGTTEIGARATAAATEVKTFSMMMDTLKESAQSGWAQTWEVFVGDFEEAKSFFTELSGIFGDIIGKSAERRNTFFGEALTSNYDKLIDKIAEAGVETSKFEESIRKVVGDNKLDTIVDKYGSIKKAAQEGAISSDTLKKALDGISSSTETVSAATDKLSRTLWWGKEGEDVKQLQNILDKLGYDLGEKGVDGIIGKYTSKAIGEFQKASGLYADGIVGPDTIKALKEAAKGIEEVTESVDKQIDSWDELVDEIDKVSGRELLLESLMNIIKAIQRPLEAVGEAFRNTFSISPDQLYDALESIKSFTDSFVPKGVLDATTWKDLEHNLGDIGIKFTDFEKRLVETLDKHGVDVDELIEKYGDLGKAFEDGAISFDYIKEALLSFDGITESLLKGGETADKVRRTFEGLFAIFKILGTITAGPIKLAFSVVTKFLSKMGLSLLDVTASIGDSLVSLSNKIDSVIDTISTIIVDGVGKWIAEFQETQLFKTCAEWISEAAKTISDAVTDIQDKIEKFEMSNMIQRLETFSDFMSRVATKLANSETFVTIVDAICGAISKLKSYLPKFKLPEFNITNLTSLSKLFANFEGLGITSITGTITELGSYFKGLQSFKWETFKNNALEKFVSFWLKTGDNIKIAFEKCKEVALAIKRFVFGTEEVDLPLILSVAEKFMGLILAIKALSVLNKLVSPFDNITDALNNFAGALKWDAMSSAFKSMALALGVFAVCLVIIGNMGTKEALASAGILIALMIVMGAVVSAIAFFAGKIDGGLNLMGAATSLLMIVGSIMLMVNTLKMIDGMKLEHPGKTFAILAGILIALTAGVRMISAAGGSSFKSVAAILTLMAALKLILEVIESYDKFDWSGKSGAIKKMVTMLIVLSAAINIASRGVKAGASSQGLALLLIAMVISLKILLSVMQDFAAMDTNTLVKGGLVVTALLGIMTLMATALSYANKGSVLEKGQKSVNNFTGLAVALLAVVAAIWLLGKMDLETLKQGGFAVGQILLLFTAMLSAVGLACSGLKIGSLITMMVAIGVLMAEIAIILHTMKSIPWEQSLGSAAALSAVLLSIAGVLRVLTKHDVKAANIFKWVGAMATLALVIGELAAVLYLLKNVNPTNSIGNVVALSGLLYAMSGVLIMLTKHRNSAKSIYKWVGAMAVFSLVMAELAIVLNLVKDVNPANAIGNVVALTGLLIGMAACLTTLTQYKANAKSIYKWVGAMAAFALVAAELAIVLNLIKDVNPANAIGNVIAIDALLIGMSLCLTTLSKHRNGAKSIYKWIGAMAAFGLVLAELAVVLHLMKDIDPVNAIGNVVALSALLLAVTASLTILSMCKVKANFGVIGALAVLSLVAAELVGVMYLMRGLDPASVIPQVIALSTLVTVLSLVLIPLAAVGTLGTAGLLGVGTLATLSASLFILVGVLATMDLVSNATSNAKILASLVSTLALVLIPLTVIGAFGVAGITGVGIMAVMMTSLFIIVGILASMQGIKNAQANADILITLLTTMTDALVQISLLAPLAVVGVGALSALILLVAGLGAFVVAIGAVLEYAPKLEKFLDTGIDMFKKLAEGIGEIISSFAVGLTSGLAEAGTNLTRFAVAVLPFVTLMGGIKDNVLDGATNLSKAMVALLGADFLAGIANNTGMSLTDLGTDLSGFASNIGDFMSAMGSIKPDTVTGVETLCDALNALSTANLKDAIAQILPGDNSLSSFGTNIKEFAACIKDAAGSLSGITDDDVANIKRSATAGEALAELNGAIPAQGGWAQNIMGSKELSTFGKSIDAFADFLVSYSEKVSGKNIDAGAITASATAARAVADLNGAIPAQGGWAQNIMGSKELGAFGQSIVAFAECIVNYSAIVAGADMNTEAITKSAEAAGALAELNGKLPSQNGLYQAVMGEKNLGEFGTQLSSFATGIAAYATAAAQIDESKITSITNSGKAIDELTLVMDKIPASGGWGDSIFGSSDGVSFGASLVSVATGITSYCTAAANITEGSITSIQTSGKAIDELSLVMEGLPETDNTTKATSLVTAVNSLVNVGSAINRLSTSAYDYSGIDALKTPISTIATLTNNIAVDTLSSDFASLKAAVDNAVSCAKSLSGLSGTSYDGIDAFKTAISELSSVDISGVVSAFTGASAQMLSAGANLISSVARGMQSMRGSVQTAATATVSSAAAALNGQASKFLSAGKSMANMIVTGLNSGRPGASSAGTSIASSAVSALRSGYSGANSAGAYLGDGFISGINSKRGAAWSAGYTLGEFALQGIKDALRTASPSKEGIKIGNYLGAGLVIGMNDTGKSVYSAGETMGNDALSGLSNSISSISSVIESDMDTQPTIRPVLDLSDVRSGANAISGLLGSGSSIGVMTNIGAINSMMNRRGQNGAESEIVAAIDKLRKDLGNVGSTTYTIGDITYDDGSNVSNAVRALVREARLERRR